MLSLLYIQEQMVVVIIPFLVQAITKNLVGEFFWTTNMNEYAEIVYKATDSFAITAGLGSIADNHIYLVKGVVPFGVQAKATIGPGSERYYIHLKHYK